MNTLAIDTSTTRGGVALLCDGILRLEENFVADRSHSASLFTVLERALAAISGEHLDQIAIGLGPGSYAGVRIAIAAAIGLEFGLGARMVGVPSAAALETAEPHYLAIGDARRETFYFTRVENGICREGPLLATESDLRARLAGRPTLPAFTSAPIPEFPDARIARPSAAKIARIAAEGIGPPVTGDLEPIYLREPHITQPKAK
jgi:tRNA threonylcarbamoyladenosine biosynthesis protein TsaB